jgi:hypothetical protein
MKTTRPRPFLQFQAFGETVVVPFPKFRLKDDWAFFEFCQDNRHYPLCFKREADGEVRLLPPSGSEAGRINVEVVIHLSYVESL